MAIGAGMAGIMLVAGIAFAATPLPSEIFQINDGNVTHDTSPPAAPVDWEDVFSGSGGTATTLPTVTNKTLSDLTIGFETVTPVKGTQVFLRDALAFDPLLSPWQSETCTNASSVDKGDTTVFTGAGSEKNGDPFASMTWAAGSIPNNKDDLGNLYATAYKNSDGHVIIYFAGERVDNRGSAFLDVEFLHSPVARTTTGYDSNGCPKGSFSGTRSDGDIIIGLQYEQQPGGSTPAKLGTPAVYEYSTAAGGYVLATSLPSNTVAVTSNNGTIDCGSWGCRTSSATQLTQDTLPASEFFEGFIDTANLPQPLTGCLNTFFGHTRSSNPITSTLKDFAQGTFSTCTTGLQTAPSSSAVVAGTSVTDTATLTLGGGLGLPPVQPAPTGTVAFGICPGSGTCTTSTSGYVSLGDGSPLSGSGTSFSSTSAPFDTSGLSGTYCFLGRYVPGVDDPYPAAQDGNANECFDIVNGTVSITPSATNEVGTAHVFTVTATATGNAVPSGIEITPALDSTVGLTQNNSTCDAPDTDATGMVYTCTLTINSDTVGTYTASARADFFYDGASPLFSRTSNGADGNSADAVKKYVDASISITPSATNEVGQDHAFTVTVTATGPVTPASFTITPSVSPTPDTTNTSTCDSPTVALDGMSATCTITINNSTIGTFTAGASADIAYTDGPTLTRATGDGVHGDSADAVKKYVDASISITPSATNEVGQDHAFTVTVTATGPVTPASFTITPSVSPTPDTTNTSTCDSPTVALDGMSATCTITINNSTIGTFTAGASADIAYTDGPTLTRATGDGVHGDSADAVKKYVDASISITPSATNEVGQDHAFTVTVTATGPVTPASFTITPSVSPTPDTTNTSTCDSPTVALDGMSATCTITINNSTIGTFTAGASADIAYTDGPTLTRATGDGVHGDSADAVKKYVDASISITPSATNEVGQDHAFTVTVTATGPVTPASFTITPSVSPTPDTTNTSTCDSPTVALDGMSATCTITINNSTIGTFTAGASADIAYTDGPTLTRATGDGVHGDSADAVKKYVDASISITPSATNEVGQDHAFTVTVTATGPVTPASFTITPSVSPTPDTTNTSTCDSPTVALDGMSATCTITINNSTIGTFTAGASADIAYTDGPTLTRATGDGVHGDSADAVKKYVDASISITPSATNEVGQDHAFTVTVTATGPVTPASFTITPSVSPTPDTTNTSTCDSPTVALDGMSATCTITINNSTIGTFTAGASADIAYTDGPTLTRATGDGVHGDSADAVKKYVDASISITPSATNFIYSAHTFTVTVTALPGSATPVSFGTITPSVSPTPDTTNTSTCDSPTVALDGMSATCTITINNSTIGTFTANASAQITMGGVTVTRDTDPSTTEIGAGPDGSGPAVKVYRSAQVSLTKTFEVGPITTLGEACFTLTRTSPTGAGTPPLSTDSAEQCDTSSSITLTWRNLVAGSYTISESKTPAGYSAMTDITFAVVADDFSTSNLNQSFTRSDPLLKGTLKIAKTISGSSDLGTFSFRFNVQPCGSDSSCTTPGTSLGTFTVDNANNPVTVSSNLAEGYYLITELPVAGFTPDTLTQIAAVPAGGTVTKTFNNRPTSFSQLVPTQTTCQQFADGTAMTENVFSYGVKRGAINNVSPGVVFYYTKVNATGSTLEFDLVQTQSPDNVLPLLGVRSVSVFNSACGTLSSGVTITEPAAGVVHVTITGASAGSAYYANIKIDPGTIVGAAVAKSGTPPAYPTVAFTYATWIPDKSSGAQVSSASGLIQPK